MINSFLCCLCFLLAICSIAPTAGAASNQGDPVLGEWVWVMDQPYRFKADGTFTGAPGLKGTWKYTGDDGAQVVRYYRLSFKGDNEPEKFELNRGTREGHEFVTGQVIRLGKRFKVKKIEK